MENFSLGLVIVSISVGIFCDGEVVTQFFKTHGPKVKISGEQIHKSRSQMSREARILWDYLALLKNNVKGSSSGSLQETQRSYLKRPSNVKSLFSNNSPSNTEQPRRPIDSKTRNTGLNAPVSRQRQNTPDRHDKFLHQLLLSNRGMTVNLFHSPKPKTRLNAFATTSLMSDSRLTTQKPIWTAGILTTFEPDISTLPPVVVIPPRKLKKPVQDISTVTRFGQTYSASSRSADWTLASSPKYTTNVYLSSQWKTSPGGYASTTGPHDKPTSIVTSLPSPIQQAPGTNLANTESMSNGIDELNTTLTNNLSSKTTQIQKTSQAAIETITKSSVSTHTSMPKASVTRITISTPHESDSTPIIQPKRSAVLDRPVALALTSERKTTTTPSAETFLKQLKNASFWNNLQQVKPDSVKTDAAACDQKCKVLENVCQNGGTCVSSCSGFTCVCADGYTGYVCDKTINPGP